MSAAATTPETPFRALDDLPPGAEVVTVNPHPRQFELLQLLRNPDNREVYARCGRRFGKTFVVALASVEFATQNPESPAPGWEGGRRPRTEIAIIGPDYQRSRRVWQEILDTFRPAVEKFRESDLRLVLRGGAQIAVFSGENIDSIRGGGFDLAILDEAVGLSEEGVRSAVMPSLADRSGRLWAISSPKFGKKNWFNRRCLDAEQGATPHVVGFHGRTSDNPRISRTWLDLERSRTDPLTWAEEFEAEVLDQSASWLDPSLIKYIDTKFIPGNTFKVLVADWAWGTPEPGMVDSETARRKDFNVLALLEQDTLGNVYVTDGIVEKFLEPDEGFQLAAELIRKYDVRRFVVEKIGDDMFGRMWRKFAMTRALQEVGMVRPVRKKDWKAQAIRHWSAEVLGRGKFFMKTGCPLAPALIEEMQAYNEAASKKDRVHDDVLVTMADVLLPGVWQGPRSREASHVHPVKDLYMLAEANAWANGAEPRNELEPRQSRYSII